MSAIIINRSSPLAGDLHRERVTEVFRQIRANTLEGKENSLLIEAVRLTNKVMSGESLTSGEAADAAMLRSIQEWDFALVDARESAISGRPPVADIVWPQPPSGLAEFLTGY